MARYALPTMLGALLGAAGVAAFAACTDLPDAPPPSAFSDAAPEAATSGIGTGFDGAFSMGDGGSLFDAACATGTAKALRDPLYMLIVLDASGSMLGDSKWQAVVPALDAFFDDLVSRKDQTLALGLTIFSDTNDTTRGEGPYSKMDVPIAVVDAAQVAMLRARLDNARPQFDTPTFSVLSGQYPVLEAFTPAAPLPAGGKKVLVFMTDGVPYPDDAGTERQQSVQLVGQELAKASPGGPILTLAVGIGYFFPYDPGNYDPMFMGQLAVAGGAPNQPCNPQDVMNPDDFCHFQVTPLSNATALEQEFRITLDRIRSRVASCEFALDKRDGGPSLDPGSANVVFTDDMGEESVVPQDPTDGWTYDDPNDPQRIVLHGKSCDALKSNVDGKVTVVLGCKTVIR